MDKSEIRRLLNDWEKREYVAKQTLLAEHQNRFKREMEQIIERCYQEGGHLWVDIPLDLRNPNSVNYLQCHWCRVKAPRTRK